MFILDESGSFCDCNGILHNLAMCRYFLPSVCFILLSLHKGANRKDMSTCLFHVQNLFDFGFDGRNNFILIRMCPLDHELGVNVIV